MTLPITLIIEGGQLVVGQFDARPPRPRPLGGPAAWDCDAGPQVFTVAYSAGMTDESLFVQTLDWLDKVAQHPVQEYEMLMASGRLRLLLLDSTPLIDRVNSSRRFDIRYRVVRNPGPPPPPLPAPMFWGVLDGLSPEVLSQMAPNHTMPIESLKRSAFLHERVMIYEGEDVTVRDLIQHLAVVAGGVHTGPPRTTREVKLDEMAEKVTMEGKSMAVRCLRGVVLVVLESLTPLRDAIVEGG